VVAARRHFPNEREEEAYAIAGKGKALEGQGYYEEAAESFEKALIIAEKAGAPQHDVVVALGNLARVHQLQKNKKKAANTYRRLIAFMNKVKATRGNAIFMCSYFAKSYIALDQPDRAELFIQRNLELEKAATGMVSPDAMRLQGRVLLGLKKFDESNAAFEAAIDKLAEEKNLWRPERSLFHLEYAESLLQQGKLPEAKKQAEQALKIQRKLLREDHPLIKEASAILSKTDAKRSSPKSE
jgi:tetratricopeptide (TPR) repeat protein